MFLLAAFLAAACGHEPVRAQSVSGEQLADQSRGGTSPGSLQTTSALLARIKGGKASIRVPAVSGSVQLSGASGVMLYSAVGGRFAPAESSPPAKEGPGRQQISSGSEGDPLPAAYALIQNYPNPFNPTSVIRYALPVQSTVTLKVYDVIGREVATLIDGELQPAGYRSVEFNGANLASGVYYYKISAGTFSEVKKMMLVR